VTSDSSSVKAPKKPGLSRRSTSAHVPHKGEVFSVDDAEEEIDLDLDRPKKRDGGRRAQMASGSLRRQASTLRRRPTAQAPTLAKVDSSGDEDLQQVQQDSSSAPPVESEEPAVTSEEEETVKARDDPEACDDDEGDVSDAESFTLKDRQEAINETHPFGIRIWKPALYKKDRSVQKTAEDDVHSSPGGHVSAWLLSFNFLWTIMFGWWLALICITGAIVCVVVSFASESSMAYAVVLSGLAKYLLNPFGKYVKLLQDEAYAEEDEGEGRSISEYEQWQSGDLEEGRLFFGPTSMSRSLIGRRRTSVDSNDETQSLLGRTRRGLSQGNVDAKVKRRLFGRGEWNVGRVVFFVFFYGLITPTLLLVSGICWLCVFSIPMGKVTLLLFDHLRRHPLALSFHSESSDTRYPGEPASSILLCTYRAVGWRYWKYTIDGTNIFLFNLLAIVAFTIFDYWVLDQTFDIKYFVTSQGFIFALALFSIIPLAYFIGQAVASISAQSSMGVGATVNAFFSTIVEVFLYCVALNEGKHQLVEGSIIGSIFAGILFLPGLSMCFGAIKRKTQRFNVKSAGVTSTMMLFAIIGAFSPTLFYQIYGSVSLYLLSSSTSLTLNSTSSNAPSAIQSICHLETAIAVAASSHRSLPSMTGSTKKPSFPTFGSPPLCFSSPT
jgi:Ca2+:H+ antiporter